MDKIELNKDTIIGWLGIPTMYKFHIFGEKYNIIYKKSFNEMIDINSIRRKGLTWDVLESYFPGISNNPNSIQIEQLVIYTD